MRLVGSLGVHAVLGAALFALVSHRARPAPAPASPSRIELVDAHAAPAVVPPPPVRVASAPPASAGGGSAPGRRAARGATKTAAFEDPRGSITFDVGDARDVGDTRDAGGAGAGTGAGRGTGIGFGEGAAIAQHGDELAPPPPPPPPKVSKARPPRLIFPSRQREALDAQLFVMRVTVDRDGYVSGARLVRGLGGRRDEVAQDQIWRFRYDPALDDDGHPIAATIEQRFLVQ